MVIDSSDEEDEEEDDEQSQETNDSPFVPNEDSATQLELEPYSSLSVEQMHQKIQEEMCCYPRDDLGHGLARALRRAYVDMCFISVQKGGPRNVIAEIGEFQKHVNAHNGKWTREDIRKEIVSSFS